MIPIKFIRLVVLAWCIQLCTNMAYGQTKVLSGVYAGVKLMPSVTPGGGMNRIDEVILFRPDGTFNDELDKPDWQKRTTGRYSIAGKKLTLKFSKDGDVSDYEIQSSDKIDAGSFILFKHPMDNSVPKGFLEFKKLSSMGGIGTNMAFVGTSSIRGLYFDGKGRFSTNSENTSVVAGDGIGGGGGNKSSGAGTYKVSNGTLTLTFDNGKTQVHSFYCRPSQKPVMAVIDGDIYFMKDEKEIAADKASSATQRNKSSSATNSKANTNATGNLADAKTLLLKANATHGGTKLDNIKTITFEATVQGILATGYVDVTGERLRLEMSKGGKLLQVQQLEGGSGWEWQAGKSAPLSTTRANEMRTSFYTGILGLRKSEIEALTVESVKTGKAGTAIVCMQNGKRYAFIINDKGQMSASGDLATRVPLTTVYSDFRQTDGILMPYNELNTAGKQRLSTQYSNFRINPMIPPQTWDKPGAN
ncbi:hypothetical protein LJ707_08590 [Mucilaginibacter sp. UR6-1]|uniref:hypothetical protein n=1 Tax=Mucilaginibacter sp. UR6-1 TaxID=1435643 RepID=UPI001E63D2FF|nr:hypothetical protein [Mucilaginibacter sp. UR6-1]MCC8408985.1 hypothetical protein [Mucilaginibacter sp. UR6-1]